MSVPWTGAFANVATAGQRITGWSENTTAAGTLKNVAGTGRYLDGNSMSAFSGLEITGNVNYHVATSRRVKWQQAFMGTGTADTDGPRLNTGNTWASFASWYAIQPRVILIASPRRGALPPRLSCRVGARLSAAGGAGNDGYVRIYSFATKNEALSGYPAAVQAVADSGLTTSYAQFVIDDAQTTYPATPGLATAVTIDVPAVSIERIAHPGVPTLPDVEVWVTYLVLACIGNGSGEGPYVQAVQVIEETRGA